jgi:hypothetical protein
LVGRANVCEWMLKAGRMKSRDPPPRRWNIQPIARQRSKGRRRPIIVLAAAKWEV